MTTIRLPKEVAYRLANFTHSVPMSLYAENRQRLVTRLKKDNPGISDNGVILLKGGTESTYGNGSGDVSYTFRQESHFHWAFGVREPDCYGAISLKDASATLFVPEFPDNYKIWFGKIKTREEIREEYQVEACDFENNLESFLVDYKPETVYLLKGKNTDSGKVHQPFDHSCLTKESLQKLKIDENKLWNSIVECRVTKTEKELDVMRYATKMSSDAHKHVMKTIRPGWYEFQAESEFCNYVYRFGGMRHVGYCCIAATQENAAVLHYGHAGEPNSGEIKDGDMAMFDMGGEYCCYTADISCSFPINGKFSEKQKLIYSAVYDAWKSVQDNLKVGVWWQDMHRLAETRILEHLKNAGLLKGRVEDMMTDRLGALFMPHGLGHLIGIDVHDVGGYMPHTPKRSSEPGLSSLRTARQMEKNMCITVEPGCYFVWSVIEDTFNKNAGLAKYLNMEALSEFKDFGGIRIESDVIIKEDGIEDMCSVPRTIEEIETFIQESRKDMDN